MQDSPSVLISGNSTEISGLKAGIERLIPGIVIVTADSGKDTLKTAQSASYDLFISFFSLSDMKGTELLEKLSAVIKKPAFLLIYKNKDKGNILDALECGGEFSIQKYAEPEILAKKTADKIRIIIRRKKDEILQCIPKPREVSYFRESPDGIFITDSNGHFIDVNPAACTMTGYSREELLDMSIPDVHDPSAVKEGLEAFVEVGITGHSYGEFLFRKKTGDELYMSVDSVRTGPDEFVGFCRDITDRVLALRKLQESEERYRGLFEGVPDYIIVHRKGKILFANPPVVNTFGRPEKSLIGSYIMDYVAEESKEKAISAMKRRTAGELVSKYEIVVNTKYGPRITEVAGTLIKYEGEDAIIIVLTDITEIKKSGEYAKLLAGMADNAPASIIVHNFDGDMLYANEETFRLHGYSRDEFMDMNLSDINTPEFRDKLDRRLKEIKAKRELHYDTEHFRKNGSKIPLHVNVKLTEWEGRQVLLNIATDLTERKKAENLLKERNIFLQRLIDTIPNPIFYKDSEGRYIGCNIAFEEYTGIQRKNILGKTVYDISIKELADVYKEHEKVLFEKPGVQKYESKMEYADGKLHDVIFYKATYNDIKGDTAGTVGVILDISERKKMEDALKRSEEKFKSYLNYAMEGIMVADPFGSYIDVNPAACRLLGYTEDELLALGIPDVVQPDELEVVIAEFESIKDKGHISSEITMLSKDKNPISVMLSAVRMPDENILGIHTNITDLKNAEDGLKEANRKLNLLSSITRHDILNQLTGIIAFLEMIEMDREFAPGSDAEKYLKKISGAAQTIKRQILFTKDYKDMGEQAPRWQKVSTIVDDTAKTRSFEGIKVENHLNDLEIYADPLFEKVIYNLFDNAVKHGEKITKIKFDLVKSKDSATIICEDDGMGIPEEFKEKIFVRQHYKNTGLGLFLSGEILSITGLTIKETGIYGKGARFEILVPKGKFRFNKDKQN